MAEKSYEVTIGVVSLVFGNVAWNRDSSTTQLADETVLLTWRKSSSGIVDHRYKFHPFLPCNQVFVAVLTHTISDVTKVSRLRTHNSRLTTVVILAFAA